MYCFECDHRPIYNYNLSQIIIIFGYIFYIFVTKAKFKKEYNEHNTFAKKKERRMPIVRDTPVI